MIDYPTYSAKRITIDAIVGSTTFGGMHPTMRERVRALIEASGGSVGLGQGLRDSKQQLQMFLARHAVDPAGDITFDGQRWRLLAGMAPAAPPGRSMHEIGLAADMTGDMRWVRQNVPQFGLQTFEKVNGEPWHVQPVELPRGRTSYERNPTWGMPPWAAVAGAHGAADEQPSGIIASTQPLTPALRAVPGDVGLAVVVLTEALIARGLIADDTSHRDGVYGPDDVAVVRQFQRTSALVVDGVVGPQTWGALLQVVKPGDSGAHVRTLQVTLIGRGLLADADDSRDGAYGSQTQSVIRSFQSLAGLRPDGEVGPKTWAALIGVTTTTPTRGGDDGGDSETFDLDDIDMLAVYDGMPAV